MASDQLRRDAGADKQEDFQIVRDVVPEKVAHFSSLAEKAAAGDQSDIPVSVFNEVPTSGRAVHHIHGTETQKRDGQKREEQRRKNESMEIEGVGAKEEEGPTLDEITNLRQDAQQKSVEAVKALGERYQQVKDKIGEGAGTTAQYLSEKTTPLKDALVDKTKQAKDSISSAADYTAQTAQQAKEKAVDLSGQTTQQAAEYTSEAKEKVPSAVERVQGATVGTAQKVGGYVGEKAVAAKDMAVGAGKTTAGYTGKVAVEAKDRAVAAGWGVASYATEKTVAATKATAGAVGGAAGYVGDKAAGAKDTVTGYVGEKIVQAKDAMIGAQESLAEYTARKKAEADRELETTKKSTTAVGDEGKGVFTIGGDDGEDKSKGQQREVKEEGVLQAIGETLVEIVQGTTQAPFGVGSDQGSGKGPGKVLEKEE